MKFLAAITLTFLLPTALTAPLPSSTLSKRALTLRTYNSMSISDTPAGNAEQEALDVWTAGLDLSDLTQISKDDLDILKVQRENAEKAETEAFNPAIDAASGDEKEELECGKTKNKVLKLTGLAQVRRIALAQAAAEGDDTSRIEEQLADTERKLANNIAADRENAGRQCRGVSFVGKTSV